MYLSGNLQFLRKRDKITQEDLADKLGVSRQSVSKWENGEAYPETDKLIALCDLYDVTLDALMRSDLTEAQGNAEVKDGGSKRAASAGEFIAHMNRFSRAIAVGVMLIILGVALCVGISGYGASLTGGAKQLADIMSGVAVIVFVAAAVFLFIFFGMEHDKFVKDNPKMEKIHDDNSIDRFASRFKIAMACLISAILVDVVYLIVFCALIDSNVIEFENADTAVCTVTAIFTAALAFIVGGLVYFGIQRGKYFVEEYNKQNASERSPQGKRIGAICGAVMLAATAVFLLLGFVWNLWHPAWVVFPIGGIICAVISNIAKAFTRDDDK